MTMGKVIRMAAALGMALVLAACSSNNSGIKNDRDTALDRVTELETLLMQAQADLDAAQQQAMEDLAARQAMLDQATMDLAGVRQELADLQASGRQEDADRIAALETSESDLMGQVATLTMDRDMAQTNVGTAHTAVTDAMDALRAAGAEGADLAALVADVVTTLNEQTEIADKATRDARIAEIAMVYGWLSADLESDPALPTDLLQAADAVPDDPNGEGSTQAAPTEKLWVQDYNPAIALIADTPDARTQGDWSLARIPGGSITLAGDGMGSADGTFDGVEGKFTCPSGCTMAIDDDGMRTGSGGDWSFTPSDGALALRQEKDPDYVSFSYWLAMDDDEMPTGFYVYYGPTGALMARETFPAETDGGDRTTAITATYSGDAGGKYATRDITGVGQKGYFTADAMLSAKFLMDVTELRGTISNFMTGNDDHLPANMSVSLGMTDSNAGGVFSGMTASKVDVLGLGSGDWQATLYGGENDAAAEEAAGVFNFSWGLGSVAGGFAAKMDEDE
jgi:hypothetical protein